MNVLILAYNRPDIANKLLEKLMLVKPEKVFLSLDGPLSSREGDVINCIRVKDVFDKINWECDVFYKIHNENVGCNKNALQAIDWFFTNVDEGIILEDDCIPQTSFFEYAQILLDKYKNHENIFMISGTCLIPEQNDEYSYRYSKLINIWGWATWKRTWNKRITDLKIWDKVKNTDLLKCYGREEYRQWRLINEQSDGTVNWKWSAIWRLTCLVNNGISVIPNVNMINNIGFNRSDSTHTKFDHPVAHQPVSQINLPLVCPKDILVDRELDEKVLTWYYDNII